MFTRPTIVPKMNPAPFFSSNRMFCRNFSHTILILFHKPHPWVPCAGFVVQPPQSSQNFLVKHTSIIVIPLPQTAIATFQQGLIKICKLPNPQPPFAIRVQTLSQPTKWCLNSSPKPPHSFLNFHSVFPHSF